MKTLNFGTFDDNDSIVCQPFSGDSKGIKTDDAFFCLRLDKIEQNTKFVAFFATSALVSGVKRKHGDFVMITTWEQEATCRVVDNITRKELMSLKIEHQQSPAGVLLLLLVRGEKNGEWEIWPCSKFFKPRMPYGMQVIGEKDCTEFLSKFVASGEVDKMFNVKK